MNRQHNEPIRFERAVASLDDGGRDCRLVLLGATERIAAGTVAAQPIDQLQARRQEGDVRRVADSIEQFERIKHALAQLIERFPLELLVAHAACDGIGCVLMISVLNSELDRLLKQLDAFIDGLVPMRRKHTPKEVHGRQH